MKRNSFDKIASYLCEHYGNSVVARLLTSSGNIVPKCYIHYGTNTIFTTDVNKKKYVYININN